MSDASRTSRSTHRAFVVNGLRCGKGMDVEGHRQLPTNTARAQEIIIRLLKYLVGTRLAGSTAHRVECAFGVISQRDVGWTCSRCTAKRHAQQMNEHPMGRPHRKDQAHEKDGREIFCRGALPELAREDDHSWCRREHPIEECKVYGIGLSDAKDLGKHARQ
eukprot:scaffold10043_cov27-Tisochrysis_lutea.AAC.2